MVSKDNTFYLKTSDKRFKGTTYDVEREKNVLSWLENKIDAPKVVHFTSDEDYDYLLMSEAKGMNLSQNIGISPDDIIKIYAESVITMQSLDITDCELNSCVEFRLSELNYLLDNGLAAEDDFSEDNISFKTPRELAEYLECNMPKEELVFSHGDLCSANIILASNGARSFIDWGRGGKADKWYDIAFCVRSIRNDLKQEQYVDKFFSLLGCSPDWNKINYFLLLDQLF